MRPTELQSVSTEEHRANVSWGAIFAGGVTSLAIQATFMTLGAGIGFSVYDPAQGDSLTSGSMIRAGIFTLITALIALFAGGAVAGRLAGFRLRSVSALHGLCSWAVVTVVTVGFVLSGIGRATSMTVGAIGGAAKSVVSAGASMVGRADVDVGSVIAEAKQILRDTGKPALNPDRVAREARELPQDAAQSQATPGGTTGADVIENKVAEKAAALDRDALANVVAKRLNVTRAEADRLITQAEDQAGEVVEQTQQGLADLKQKSLNMAQQGTEVAANVSWTAFFSMLLGALVAVAGGIFGGPAGMRGRRPASVELQRAA